MLNFHFNQTYYLISHKIFFPSTRQTELIVHWNNLLCIVFKSLAPGDIPMKLPPALQNLETWSSLIWYYFTYLDGLCLLSYSKIAKYVITHRLCKCCYSFLKSANHFRDSPFFLCLWCIGCIKTLFSIDEEFLATAVEFYEAQENEGILSRLPKVKFANRVGNDCEVKFISSLVDCCPMLDNFNQPQ